MTISEKSYKIIWGQFSGRCALCRKDVIHLTEGGVTSLIGEVAHIVGEQVGAARGKSDLSLDERNDPDNLMLLCREHHKIIDDDVGTYSVEYLERKKREHLDWLRATLSPVKPWQSNLSQLCYINVPRLCEQAELKGYQVDLRKYREDQTLHSLRWELNHVMSAFQNVLGLLEFSTIPLQELVLHEGHIGSPISFDRTRFRTKNIAFEAINATSRWHQNFTGDLEKDPHIYAKLGEFKLVIFIDPNWITTSTAFTLFKPSSGQSVFSGLGIITNVDYEKKVITATAWVIGLPRGPFDETFGRSEVEREKPPSSNSHLDLDALVDMPEAVRHNIYFSPPPSECDLCQKALSEEKYMIDGGVRGVGYWACMCANCYLKKGRGIGWGVGQLYLRSKHGWLAVAGLDPSGPADENL